MPTLKPLWKPSQDSIAGSQMQEFIARMAQRHGIETTWNALAEWAVSERELFWPELVEFANIKSHSEATAVFDGEGMLGGKWFTGMNLNYAEHLLRFRDDRIAIHFEDERGSSRDVSFGELGLQVARFAAGLRRSGIRNGDRVAGFLPNIPEAVVAMLATASLGAAWSSCSPDFGVNGVLDRFGQIEPRVLVAADGYSYNGKHFDCLARVREIVGHLSSLTSVVIVPYIDVRPDLSAMSSTTLWEEFLGDCDTDAPPTFESVPFDHPLFVMYSSGTTGKPKCIVHGHGGTLLQHMKELMLHCDLRREDSIFYFTTCGWMMWNWLVSSLGVGATIVLYEGSPVFPGVTRLWEMLEREKITVFGTSPKYISMCQKQAVDPVKQFDLSQLRCILSTGSPLSAEQFEWVYAHVKGDLQLSSISGGTDIISCFMLGNPVLPVYAGEIQCPGLGMDVHAFDGNGNSVVGEKGELVCISPFPSQPVCFWDDPKDKKYSGAYFEHYDGIWRHGDLIEITESGGVIVHGRSDATLNPGGVRIGTAEIYRVVEAMEEVTDSIAVAKRIDHDVEICLFVVLENGLNLDQDLEDRIRRRIAEGATRRHVPKHIRQVTAIPHTISGKKVELAVTQIIHGQDVKNRDALANPDALNQFRSLV